MSKAENIRTSGFSSFSTQKFPKAMALNTLKEDDENAITLEREEVMIPPTGGVPTLRKAHFLKPFLNPINQPLPKLPPFSLTSNPNIQEIKERVIFKGRVKPQKGWKKWVENLQQTHQSIWKKVGIFDAIRASTYNIKRDNELVIALAEKWCCVTNTFIFPWGESTITLEDIMILGGFSVLGVSVLSPFQGRSFFEIESKLATACYTVKKNCSGPMTHYGWMNYFKGMGGELEHVALLDLWLSRYVFNTNSYNLITPNVFRIAISLAKGTKIALAPAVLACIYKDLALLKQYIVASLGEGRNDGSKLVLWAPFQLVQLWAWERFPITLHPKPAALVHGQPRLARWQNLKKLRVRSLRVEIESAGDEFMWRPYALYLENWEFPKFYCDDEMCVLVNSEVEEELLSYARCLRACELVGLESIELYLPHRVGMQFGFDQEIPDFVRRSNGNAELAWSSYDKPLDGLKFCLRSRLVEGDVTVQYSSWWRGVLGLGEEALVYRRRRSTCPRRMKELTQILHGSEKGNDKKASVCAPSQCDEAKSSESVESSKEMAMEKSPFCEGMPSPNALTVVNEPTWVSGTPMMGLEVEDTEKCMQLVTKVDSRKEVTGSNTDTKSEALSVKEPLMDLEDKGLCAVLNEDMQDKSAEAVNTKQVTISSNDVIIIDDNDEEEDNDLIHLKTQGSLLKARMDRLEKMVSILKKARFGSG